MTLTSASARRSTGTFESRAAHFLWRGKMTRPGHWPRSSALLLTLLASAPAVAQSSAPSQRQCFEWDAAFRAVFEEAFWICAGATLVLALLAGLLGRLFWLAAAPRLRIVATAVVVFTLTELAIVALPWLIGFGWLWFSAIDGAYFDCVPLSFDAGGFFQGLIGPGVAAIAQWPTMTYLLLGSATVAALVAWQVSSLTARLVGLRRRARGEGA